MGAGPLDKWREPTQKHAYCLAFFDSDPGENTTSRLLHEEKTMADKVQMTIPLSKMLSELAEKHEMPKKKLAELFGDLSISPSRT